MAVRAGAGGGRPRAFLLGLGMAQVIDLAAVRRAKTHAEAGGLSKLTQWRVAGEGSRQRKEWVEMAAQRAKRFQVKEFL